MRVSAERRAPAAPHGMHAVQVPPSTDGAPTAQAGGVDDLLGGLDDLSVSAAPPPAPSSAAPSDIFSLSALDSVPVPAAGAAALAGLPKLVAAEQAQGCDVHGRLSRSSTVPGQYEYCFGLRNTTAAPMTGFHVQVLPRRPGRRCTALPRVALVLLVCLPMWDVIVAALLHGEGPLSAVVTWMKLNQ